VKIITLPKIITVFDTETTGTGRNALVVSYGSVRLDFEKNEISEKFEIFVNPQLNNEELIIYEEHAYKITKISIPGMPDCDQSKFVERHTFTEELQARLQKTTSMLAHNAPFDRRLLDQTLLLEQPFTKALEVELFCSLKLSRQIFQRDEVGSFSLDNLCKHTGVDTSSREYHGALLDAELTAGYLLKLNESGIIQLDA
jgi:DNA polymerase-3 subunit epsilon